MIARLIRSQRGVTLLEMMVTIAIIGVVAAPLGAIGYSVLNRTGDDKARVTAAINIENAVHSIVSDGLMAQRTGLVPGALPVSSLNLGWIDPIEGGVYEVYYFLSGTDLRRRELLNNIVQAERSVARYVTGISFRMADADDHIFRVTASSSGGDTRVSEQGEYYVRLRAPD